MAIIKVDNVHFTYTGRKAETLQGVSLHLQEGETVLLLGASGSGKSTLALCLNGLIPQTNPGTFHGSVAIAGYETASTPLATLTQHVGMVFQDPEAQSVMMTVEEEVAFGLENLCVAPGEMDQRIESALEQVGMAERRHDPVESLSGGYKQRLALACVLAMRSRLLVFDEPTANLDPVGTQEVFAAIQELKRTGKYTILLIEHKLDEIMHFIDRVVVLAKGGTILAEGDPRVVFRDHAALLQEHGIWMPQVSLLTYHLRKQGWRLSPFPLTSDEAIDAWKPVAAETLLLAASSLSVLPSDGALPSIIAACSSEPALEVRHLSFHVGTQKILDNLSLHVPKGDFLAIVGANGAGKTTLAYHLADIVHPPRGCVLLGGQDISRFAPRQLMQQVGYVFQNPEQQFITGSVEEELRFGLQWQHLPAEEMAQRVERVLEQFGLSRYAKANPFTLSHGEKRRLSVATMLLSGQHLLILDEPTFGQDQRNATALLELLKALNEAGQTMLMITHDMTIVAEYARHVAVLAQGRLLYHGSTAQLFAQPDLIHNAHLRIPPLAALSQRLAREGHPQWRDLLTMEQFLARASRLREG